MNPPQTARSETATYRTRLLERRELSPGTVEIDLERPERFSFIAGQRIRLHHDRQHRDYSLVNAPGAPVLTLCVRLVKQGFFSGFLETCPQDSALELSGPYGYFVFHGSDRPAVWVATGTGIAPFVAMCRAGAGDAAVIHGVRTAAQLYYCDLFRQSATHYTACLSASTTGEAGHFQGRVTGYIQQRLPAGAYDFYLCGRREMIRDATRIIDERFPESRIYTEIFY